MDPITILSALALVLGGAAVVYLIIITIIAIIDWFRSRQSILETDKDNIAFTIREKLRTGKVRIVQGIWNKSEEELKDARVVEGENLDQKLDDLHDDDNLVQYK